MISTGLEKSVNGGCPEMDIDCAVQKAKESIIRSPKDYRIYSVYKSLVTSTFMSKVDFMRKLNNVRHSGVIHEGK